MPWLTKSRFMSGRQCAKRLWFEVNAPLEVREPESLAILQGRAFDDFVRKLWPGVVIDRERGMPAAIAQTSRVLAAGGVPVLHQAAVRNGEFAIIADVLRSDRGGAELVEIKASTSVRPEHVADAAFQVLVLRGARVRVERARIGHVNSAFTLQRAGEYHGLLIEQDITAEVEALLPALADEAIVLHRVMSARETPQIAMGPQCRVPYECPFIGRCSGGAPASGLSTHKDPRVRAGAADGTTSFDPGQAAVLRGHPWPRSYLDFETIGFAVPEVVGTRPYEPLPFQWSLHIEAADGGLRHAEYLATRQFGDFAALSKALIAAVPDEGPVYAYNASFEGRALELLGRLAPEHKAELARLRARLVDLLPITRRAYYHPRMMGSWSIKAVIPTITAALAYDTLGGVQDGEAAQRAFLELRNGGPDEPRRARLEQELLAYCRRDTEVLVTLARFLQS